MLKYNITEGNGGRILIIKADDLQRYTIKDTADKHIQFKRKGGQAIAVIRGQAKVYRKPNGLTFHKEYMQQNARTLWHSDSMADIDMLIDGLSEYEQSI